MDDLNYKLDDLISKFDSKVNEYKARREAQKEEARIVNYKYANLYANLVSDALDNIQDLNSREDVVIKNELFGQYAIKYSNVFSKSLKSNAILLEDKLCINLYFYAINRDKLYDEEYINQILKPLNMHVSTTETQNPNASIICTIEFYRLKKDLMSLRLHK